MKLIAVALLCVAIGLAALAGPPKPHAPQLVKVVDLRGPAGLLTDGTGRPVSVASVALSSDGRVLAIAGSAGLGTRGAGAGVVGVWLATTGRSLGTLSMSGYAPLEQVSLSSDGRLVAASSSRGTLLWETTTARLLARLPGDCAALTFAPGPRLLVLGSDGRLTTWAHGQARVRALPGPPIVTGRFLADGHRVVGLRSRRVMRSLCDWSIGIVDTTTGRSRPFRVVLEEARLSDFTAARDTGRAALFEWYDGYTVVADPPRWRVRARLKLQNWSEAMALSPDGRLLLVGSRGGGVRLLDGATGKLLSSAVGEGQYVAAACWSDDGSTAVAVSEDSGHVLNKARVWRVAR